VQEAALILHVTDLSNPRHTEMDAEVEKVLQVLEVHDRPRLRIFNKIDLLPPEELAAFSSRIAEGYGKNHVFVSAQTGVGLEELLARVDAALPKEPMVHLRLRFPLSDGRRLALVHACGHVIHSSVEADHISLEAEVPQSLAKRLEEPGGESSS
jgi:GTP-binding protein HflX